MMKTKTRVLSLLFCILALFTLLAPSVYAAENSDSIRQQDYVTSVEEVTEAEAQQEEGFFSVGNFLTTLPVMLYGMLGIFTVIVLIFICIKILVKLFPCKS